jgi:hypothetical protein
MTFEDGQHLHGFGRSTLDETVVTNDELAKTALR